RSIAPKFEPEHRNGTVRQWHYSSLYVPTGLGFVGRPWLAEEAISPRNPGTRRGHYTLHFPSVRPSPEASTNRLIMTSFSIARGGRLCGCPNIAIGMPVIFCQNQRNRSDWILSAQVDVRDVLMPTPIAYFMLFGPFHFP